MELLAAGDKSQWEVIKRWIDESDVFLLILGGRYGSIEPESQKSYTHLEYDYALSQNKAIFAVVTEEKALEERVKNSELGTKLIERDNPSEFNKFRKLVCSKMVRFWQDQKDIKLAILETLSEFSRREELTGWILGDQAVNTGELAEELARLSQENSELRARLNDSELKMYNGSTFEELYNLLNGEKIVIDSQTLYRENFEILNLITQAFDDSQPSALHLFWGLRNLSLIADTSELYSLVVRYLYKFGLIEIDRQERPARNGGYFRIESTKLNEFAQKFMLRLIKEKGNDETNKYEFTG
jgi:regulator of replication initiation timing